MIQHNVLRLIHVDLCISNIYSFLLLRSKPTAYLWIILLMDTLAISKVLGIMNKLNTNIVGHLFL